MKKGKHLQVSSMSQIRLRMFPKQNSNISERSKQKAQFATQTGGPCFSQSLRAENAKGFAQSDSIKQASPERQDH
jgi:hypothetical protein